MNRVFSQGERSREIRPEAFYIAIESRERGIIKHKLSLFCSAAIALSYFLLLLSL
jgi:hypothetical protein